MKSRENRTDKRVFLGGILIVIGGILLLNTIDVFDFRISRVIFSLPFIITIIGVFILLNTNKKLLGGILTGVGLFF